MIPAIILAAGDSTRMGRPKALLPAPDGRPFVARLVRVMAEAGVRDIVIVTGHHHSAIVEALGTDHPPVWPRIVRNPDPGRGQLSSIWTGMDALVTSDTEALMMTLVDVPMVEARTVEQVVEVWRRTRAPIVRPALGDRHGHPVVFDRQIFDELRAAALESGAKAVVRAHAAGIIDVPIQDEGCLVDVDTPDDYRALQDSFSRRSAFRQ